MDDWKDPAEEEELGAFGMHEVDEDGNPVEKEDELEEDELEDLSEEEEESL